MTPDAANNVRSPQATAHPLHAGIVGFCRKGDTSVTTSIFEAKAGIRMCRVDPKTIDSLIANQYTKSMLKELKAHMTQTGSTQASHVCRDVAKTKRLVKPLANGFDDQICTRLVLPDQPWAARIYTPEMYGQTLGHVSVFTTNNGTCEGRAYMEGSDCIVGIAYEKVPGATFLEKRRSIVSMSPESLEGLCK